jgi:thymidylate synthase ThyX
MGEYKTIHKGGSVSEKQDKFELIPIPERYELIRTKTKDTGIRLFGLKDIESEVTVIFPEFNEKFDLHSGLAYAGARKSRSEDSQINIFSEIHEAISRGTYTTGKKLNMLFGGYGHASVADMSNAFLFLDNIPMNEAFWIFNHTSQGGGQETSTRYVKIENLELRPVTELLNVNGTDRQKTQLENRWTSMQKFLESRYHKWTAKLTDPLEGYLENQLTGESRNDRKIFDSVDKRTLDVARFWIPVGARTSMGINTSIRNWVDISSQMKSSRDKSLNRLGSHVTDILSLSHFEETKDIKAELAELAKYSEGSDTLRSNIDNFAIYIAENTNVFEIIEAQMDQATIRPTNFRKIDSREFDTDGESVVFQYLVTAYPELFPDSAINIVQDLSKDQLLDLGKIIFSNHTHHELMRNPGDIRGIMYYVETALAYHRDFNRQRAFGRLVLAHETPNFESIIRAGGFNENFQLANANYWKKLKQEFEADILVFNDELTNLVKFIANEFDYYDARGLFDMLPLGYQMGTYYSAPPTQWQYMSSLRIGMGGDFGYRSATWDIMQDLGKNDPVFSQMNTHLEKPDPNDIDQVLGRS